MLKLAVFGAQTLLGRELVKVLEDRDASVLPLATGVLTREQEEGDLVVFAPDPSLLEGLDLIILAASPEGPELLENFSGRVLDLRDEPTEAWEPMPLAGVWPEGHRELRGRPALELVLALLPSLVQGFVEVSGTHLRSVACLGDRGIDGLMAQTVAVLKGNEPDIESLGYRAAFEVVPQMGRGALIEVRVPVFHGDLLILHLKSEEGRRLETHPAPMGVKWAEHPPTSREVAISAELLAHLSTSSDGQTGILTLGFDPILWGVLQPVLRVLAL
ncbi:MAG: hypothetical protein IPN59_00885 [Holophaga sp.]|nr:hypothetical protein [Holophaga sp.]